MSAVAEISLEMSPVIDGKFTLYGDRVSAYGPWAVFIVQRNAVSGRVYKEPVVVPADEAYGGVEVTLDADGWHKVWLLPAMDITTAGPSSSGLFTDGRALYYRKAQAKAVDELSFEYVEADAVVRMLESGVGYGNVAFREFVEFGKLAHEVDVVFLELFKDRMYNGGCGKDACLADRGVAALSLVRHEVRMGRLAEAGRVIERAAGTSVSGGAGEDALKTGNCGCL